MEFLRWYKNITTLVKQHRNTSYGNTWTIINFQLRDTSSNDASYILPMLIHQKCKIHQSNFSNHNLLLLLQKAGVIKLLPCLAGIKPYKSMIILRDFPKITIHCLAWCHIMTPYTQFYQVDIYWVYPLWLLLCCKKTPIFQGNPSYPPKK